MRLLILPAVVLTAFPASAVAPQRASVPQTNAAQPGRICDNAEIRHVDLDTTPKSRQLGTLPPGNLQRSVLRTVGGCLEPVIIRQNIGALGRPATTRARKDSN